MTRLMAGDENAPQAATPTSQPIVLAKSPLRSRSTTTGLIADHALDIAPGALIASTVKIQFSNGAAPCMAAVRRASIAMA